MSQNALSHRVTVPLTADQAQRAPRWTRLWMLLALFLTQGLTLTWVFWADRQNTARLLEQQAQAALEQLVRVTAVNVQGYMRASVQVVGNNHQGIEAGLLDIDQPRRLLRQFNILLDNQPQLNGVLLGRSDGRFTFVRRDGPNDAGRFERVIEVSPTRRVTTKTFDRQRRLISASTAPNNYDPRTRPWFKLAVAAPSQVVWTAPYVFASTRQPGITTAAAVRQPGGSLVVFGVDVQLRNITELLKSVQISPHGRAFVADMNFHAIAASRAWPVSVQGRVPTLQEVADPALSALLRQHARQEGVWHYVVGGQRYAAVVRGVEIQPGMRWKVGVYAPETDFTPGVQATSRRHLMLTLLASLISSLIAWPFVSRATRPLAALQRQATTDALTGLRNRASFLAQLNEHLRSPTILDTALEGALNTSGSHLGVAIFDLDGFKGVNDTYGHQIGDEVLHAVGARMLAAVRVSDTLGRLGGDEFALLVRGQSEAEIRLRVEGVLHAVARRPIVVDHIQHELTATAGLAFLETVGRPARDPQSELLARADAALIKGKKREKGRVWVEGEVTMPTLFR